MVIVSVASETFSNLIKVSFLNAGLLDLNKASHNKDNSFEFIIGGSFDGSVDIVANAYFSI